MREQRPVIDLKNDGKTETTASKQEKNSSLAQFSLPELKETAGRDGSCQTSELRSPKKRFADIIVA